VKICTFGRLTLGKERLLAMQQIKKWLRWFSEEEEVLARDIIRCRQENLKILYSFKYLCIHLQTTRMAFLMHMKGIAMPPIRAIHDIIWN
jgi:hypothetical protein